MTEEFELIGWVAEYRWAPPSWEMDLRFPKFTAWELTFNNKVYRTEEIAKQSVEQHQYSLNEIEYRYRPVYAKKQI